MFNNPAFENTRLLTVDGFLDREFCDALRKKIKKSEKLPTPLPEYQIEGIDYENGNTRPKVVVNLPGGLPQTLKEKLRGVIPQLEESFKTSLSTFADPYYAVYRTGNYLGKHADGGEMLDSKGSKIIYKLQLVIYLNDETEEMAKGGFQGGRLTIYGAIKNDAFRKFGYPIKPETGKLIAFPSTCVHEVTPVTSGERFSINTAFF